MTILQSGPHHHDHQHHHFKKKSSKVIVSELWPSWVGLCNFCCETTPCVVVAKSGRSRLYAGRLPRKQKAGGVLGGAGCSVGRVRQFTHCALHRIYNAVVGSALEGFVLRRGTTRTATRTTITTTRTTRTTGRITRSILPTNLRRVR